MAAAGDDTVSKYFKKGASVEICIDDEGFRGALYEGTVVRPPRGGKRGPARVLVEYKTLMEDEDGTRPLREELDVVQLRPLPPREAAGRRFAFGEEVDAYHIDGWWEGTITQVMEEGKGGEGRYAVFFSGTREQLSFAASELRLHREWQHGKWVPPLENSEVVEEITPVGDEKLAVVEAEHKEIKHNYSPGDEIEVGTNEEGFEGAWFIATIVKKLEEEKYLIEYESLMNDDGITPLREEVDSLHIRPCPPDIEILDRFRVGEEVDALYNDGWWTGVISKVLKKEYSVYFSTSGELMKFKHADLRLHQDWINGKWETSKKLAIVETEHKEIKHNYSPGDNIEVGTNEEGLEGAWFIATIVKKLVEEKYLIEYESLKDDDGITPLREEVDSLHIRPCPPDIEILDRFRVGEEIDALYNDGWWTGVISKVLKKEYSLYFSTSGELMKFKHADLRLHQDWINGKWETSKVKGDNVDLDHRIPLRICNRV